MSLPLCRARFYCVAFVIALVSLAPAAAFSQPTPEADAVSTVVHTYLLEQLAGLPGNKRITIDPPKNDR
jgi:flagella basal body P-ring formation protein FlgA